MPTHNGNDDRHGAGDVEERPAPSGRIVLALFSLTLLLSAFLLFSVQPFFTKMVLPLLGGSPGVWSVAMVFFQGMLLAGYAYAHLLTRKAALPVALGIHLVLVAVAFLALPISLPVGWDRPPDSGQAIWQLGLFTVALGLPFFVVSANAPLLQAWFSQTRHPHASDPYFLYGASNIGSFASLILFIVLFEPFFTVARQSTMWTAGYAALGISILLCGLMAVRSSRTGTMAQSEEQLDARVTVREAPLRWALYAFVPSGLLVAVTAHISTDIAAAPFLWVVPLALFLLTFVLAFARRPFLSVRLLSQLLPFGAAAALIVIYSPRLPPVWLGLGVHLGFFFMAALFCHSLLVQARPAASGLTRFYLWMSAGGVVGGIFAALLAPMLFNWVAEYVLLIVAAVLLRPQLTGRRHGELAALALIAAVTTAGLIAAASLGLLELFDNRLGLAIAIMAMAGVGLGFLLFSPIAHAMTIVLVIPLALLHTEASGSLFGERSFFGIVRVHETADGQYRLMTHGTTLHGAMAVQPPIVLQPGMWSPEPLTYYHRSGGLAQAIFAMQARRGGSMEHVGAIGLGTGSAVCHRAAGERWTAFEIDRSVVRAALDPDLFSFMPVCGADVPVRIGDARLRLAEEPDNSYDLLLVDAFSSDSIPVHLMTREAIELYMNKLRDDGLLVMHISNRYLELESVLAAIASEAGLAIRSGMFVPEGDDAEHPYVNSTRVAVLANDEGHFGRLLEDARLRIPDAGRTRAWTDDYSDVFSALLRGSWFD